MIFKDRFELKGQRGAGGVRETGEERAGSGISTIAKAEEKFKKASFRYLFLLIIQSKKRTQQRFLTCI